jgi:hypothetical protein
MVGHVSTFLDLINMAVPSLCGAFNVVRALDDRITESVSKVALLAAALKLNLRP